MSWTKIASPLAGQVIGSVTDAFVIAEWRDPGGPPGPPRLIAPPHLHRSDDEAWRSEEHTSELQSHSDLVCRLLLEKKKKVDLDLQSLSDEDARHPMLRHARCTA